MRTSIALSLALALGSLLQVACVSAPVEATGEAFQGAATDAPSAADCPSSVPGTLRPDADQKLTFSFVGDGVQIYTCVQDTTTGAYVWLLKAPSAVLFSKGGEIEGTHYAGPTWEANDGSKVVGKRVAGVSVDPTAIAWLLLDATSTGPDGRFSKVTSIQRLNTAGGLAPATGCDAENVGGEVEVPYTAGYFLYTTNANGQNRQCGD